MTIDQLVECLLLVAQMWDAYAAEDKAATDRFSDVVPKPDAWQAGYGAAYANCASSLRFVLEDNQLVPA